MKTLLSTFALLFVASAQAAPQPLQLNGAGATFPFPLYSKWFSEFNKAEPSIQINYQSIGSGGGIRQFLEQTVDFGATDSPMTDEQLAKAKTPVLHIPTVLGAVVITYHLPGIGKGLRLTPDVLADIFLGKISQWNDPRIVAANSALKLPADPILVVHRSDGSGTTGIFTDYLAKVSPEWKTRVGSGPAVSWPAGLGGKGNEGVTGLVKQTPGSIGYVELIYAESNALPYASLKNRSGQFVAPGTRSVSAAAAGSLKKIPADFRVSITDPEGKESYPLGGFTYLLVSQSMDKAKGQALVQFLRWAMKDGQSLAESLVYAPLPKELVKKIEARIGTIVLR
ncbi:MAG: phosphate ABC transporter substrate-binding protein PstS [Oligoflexia bacterium]|nr:phosphate ABC transporter substrate-binding protein PstS [Oligoflexia bacterium]